MLLVRSQVTDAGTEFSKTDYAAPFPPQIARFQHAQAFPYDPRGRPAQFANQLRQPLSGSII
jgi:hypothetical protein